MIRFIKQIILFNLPFILLLGFYFVNDPFKVLWKTNYEESPITLNRDYISTEMLKKKYPNCQYDSFIFGSSRSHAFHCEDWEKYLPNGSVAFHYDAFSEGIYGVWKKITYLDRSGISIDKALIITDRNFWGMTGESREYLFMEHPDYSDYSLWEFHKVFLETYLQGEFLLKYLIILTDLNKKLSNRFKDPNLDKPEPKRFTL